MIDNRREEPGVPGRTYSVSVRRESTAGAEALFDTISDGAGWSRWAGPLVPVSSWERHGTPAPGGVGAIRVVGRFPGLREEVTEHEPGRVHGYRMLSTTPMRDYRARVEFLPRDAGGTQIVWRVDFGEALPGSGLLLRPVVRAMLSTFATRLARYVERTA